MREFQKDVGRWLRACFGREVSEDKLERGDRLLEEVFELLQSGDYPKDRVAALSDYVWSRPKGEPHQEAGGVTVTLAGYCYAHGLDLGAAAGDELTRVWGKMEAIRSKQAAKPVGSALPVAAKHPYESWELFGKFLCEEDWTDLDADEFVHVWRRGEWGRLDDEWPEWREFVARQRPSAEGSE